MAMLGLTTSAMPFGAATALAAASTLYADAQISEMQDVVSAHPAVFGGLAGDPNTNLVTIYMTSKGALDASTAVSDLAVVGTQADPKLQFEPKQWRVRVIHEGRSLAELESVRQQLTTQEPWRSALAPTLARSYIDPVTHSVVLGLTEITPNASAVALQFGSLVRITQSQRTNNLSRGIDTPPFWGGDGLLDGAVACTDAFEAYKYIGGALHYGVLTAGHCYPTMGERVWNGYIDSNGGVHNGSNIGYLAARSYSNYNPDAEFLDSTAIGASLQDYEYTSWGGGGRQVKSSGTSFVGLGVCFDGEPTAYYTGSDNCSGVVLAINQCGYNNDGIYVCDQTQANSNTGTVMCRQGDSGGPVYNRSGNLVAYGIIAGIPTGNNGSICVYSEVNSSLSALGAGLIAG